MAMGWHLLGLRSCSQVRPRGLLRALPSTPIGFLFVGLQKHEPNPSPALGHTCSTPGVLELLGRLGEISANASHQQH